MGSHNASTHTSIREQTIESLDRFADIFGHSPVTMSQHYLCSENVYWGADRVGGIHKLAYTTFSLGRNITQILRP